MIEIIPNWHPVFVHFTVALLSVAALLKIGAYFVGSDSLREQWHLVARWNLWIGSVFVVLTVLSGVMAYNSVSHDTPSHAAMTDHRNWALVTSALFLVVSGWLVTLTRRGKARSGIFLATLLVATALLATTAWKGGELVYRYGLGVMSLPKADTHGHANGEEHGHGEEKESDHDNADGHHDEKKVDDHHDKLGHDNSDGHHDTPVHDNSDGHHDEKKVDDHHDDGHAH